MILLHPLDWLRVALGNERERKRTTTENYVRKAAIPLLRNSKSDHDGEERWEKKGWERRDGSGGRKE